MHVDRHRSGSEPVDRPRPVVRRLYQRVNIDDSREAEMDQTLDQLEGDRWAEPKWDSYLVTECHRLRTKPIGEFTVEDLRIMIGQHIGLPHLVPRALEILEREPLAEGDYYPGDLLISLARAEAFVASSPELLKRRLDVVDRAVVRLGGESDDLRTELIEFIDRHRPRKPQNP